MFWVMQVELRESVDEEDSAGDLWQSKIGEGGGGLKLGNVAWRDLKSCNSRLKQKSTHVQ